jgi:hypothetical protein
MHKGTALVVSVDPSPEEMKPRKEREIDISPCFLP